MTQRPAMRALFIASLLPALAAAPHAHAGTYAGAVAVDLIRGSIAGRDCNLAVKRLKSGLEEGYPEVSLLAGSMYENGICVKRDWSRAVTFYVQAHDAGEADGAARVAAGYADLANGPDVAAALWWARKLPVFRVPHCSVPKEAMADPDRFVAALAAWPRQQLAVCNYLAGVLATISAEVKYPELAARYAIGVDVTLRFLAGLPRIELQRGRSEQYELVGVVSSDKLRDRKSPRVADGFEQALSLVANRALARYPHPGGIPADTLIQVHYKFTIEERTLR